MGVGAQYMACCVHCYFPVKAGGIGSVREPLHVLPGRFRDSSQVSSKAFSALAWCNRICNVLCPVYEVSTLGRCCVLRNHVVSGDLTYKCQQAFAALHAHRLNILGFFCLYQRLVCLLESPPSDRNPSTLFFGRTSPLACHNSCH